MLINQNQTLLLFYYRTQVRL